MQKILYFVAMALFLFYAKQCYADMIYSEGGDSFSQIEGYPSYARPSIKKHVSTTTTTYTKQKKTRTHYSSYRREEKSYSARLPIILPGHNEKVIVVDPRVHAWGAYSASGKLIRSGLATCGASWCPDIGRACRTKSGVFRLYTLGSSSCVSKKYPVGEGGAPMPYCMYFNGGQGLHGSYELARANLSHGCVRISVDDARWLRFNFANVGTKVIVRSY